MGPVRLTLRGELAFVTANVTHAGKMITVPDVLVDTGRSVVALETVARGAGIDEVLVVVRAARGNRVKMVNLQLAAHRCLRDAAIAALAAVGGPGGSATRFGHCHLCRGQGIAAHTSQGIEDGGATLVELGEEAARIGSELLLLGDQPSELLVPALHAAHLLDESIHVTTEARRVIAGASDCASSASTSAMSAASSACSAAVKAPASSFSRRRSKVACVSFVQLIGPH